MNKPIGLIAVYDGRLIVDHYNNAVLFKSSEQASLVAPSGSVFYPVVKSTERKRKVNAEKLADVTKATEEGYDKLASGWNGTRVMTEEEEQALANDGPYGRIV